MAEEKKKKKKVTKKETKEKTVAKKFAKQKKEKIEEKKVVPPSPPVETPPPVEAKKEPKPKKKKEKNPKKEAMYYGTGRRKESIARVYLFPGEGRIVVNGRNFLEYIAMRKALEVMALEPLALTKTLGSYDVKAKIFGGGVASQAGALKLGIARALLTVNPDFRPVLRRQGCLTRDPRVKERKKYGHKRARKSFQYSKR